MAYHKMKTHSWISETERLTMIRVAYEEMRWVTVLFLITS